MSGYVRLVGFRLGGWPRRYGVDIRVDFVPRDLWIGLYIGGEYGEMGYANRPLYICAIPTLPIVVTLIRKARTDV